MNTAPHAKRILCYGDSNTRGYIPGSGMRYSVDKRWTGRLQMLLGEGYEIIEEGLDSRTTDIDDPKNVGKNGLTYFLPCIQSHAPLDWVIISLGTNDMKERFDNSPTQIGEGVEKLLQLATSITTYDEQQKDLPHILLVCPPHIDESVAQVIEKYRGAGPKSKALSTLYQSIASRYDVVFFDLQTITQPSSIDGYHFDMSAHACIAQEFAKLITQYDSYAH